ncbi:unnamed protein product [Eretmochelys imbricata]
MAQSCKPEPGPPARGRKRAGDSRRASYPLREAQWEPLELDREDYSLVREQHRTWAESRGAVCQKPCGPRGEAMTSGGARAVHGICLGVCRAEVTEYNPLFVKTLVCST